MTRPGYPWDIVEGALPAVARSTRVETVEYAHARDASLFRPFLLYVRQAARAIASHARVERVAVIHAATNFQNALPALLAARRLGVPFQYEMRGLWELTRASRWPGYERSGHCAFGLACEGMVVRHADKVFAISALLQQDAEARWGVSASRFALLPNCVDPARFEPADAAAVVPKRIGYAGSLMGYEGLDTLIEAVARLVGRGCRVELEIMGDGEARTALEALVQARAVGDHVRLLGKVPPEVARERLAACALVCIPRKPFEVCRLVPPIKLVEALAMGKPVIVPDLPLFREELGPEPAGWFFRPGDVDDLARVIETALSDPDRAQRLGRLGRDYAIAQRSWRRYVPLLVDSESPASVGLRCGRVGLG